MRSLFPLFLDAARTLRKQSSISILSQSAHSCKSSSDPQSCCCGVPSNTSAILGHPLIPVSLLTARCIASMFWGTYLVHGLSRDRLSDGWSLSPGCSSQAGAQVPKRTLICRNECVFLITWAKKNHMCFGLVFPRCFSACIYPRAEWDLFMCCPGFLSLWALALYPCNVHTAPCPWDSKSDS